MVTNEGGRLTRVVVCTPRERKPYDAGNTPQDYGASPGDLQKAFASMAHFSMVLRYPSADFWT